MKFEITRETAIKILREATADQDELWPDLMEKHGLYDEDADNWPDLHEVLDALMEAGPEAAPTSEVEPNADSNRLTQPVVRVKRLEWECLDASYWYTANDLAEYILRPVETWDDDDHYEPWEVRCHPDWAELAVFEFDTLEQAQQACQDDYERRVLSALEG